MPEITVDAHIKRFAVKPVGEELMVELVILADADDLDLRDLARMQRTTVSLKMCTLQMHMDEAPRATAKVAQGQTTILDSTGEEPAQVVTHFYLQLTEMPTDDKMLKKARTALRKLTGLDAKALAVELENGLPINLFDAKNGHRFAEVDAVEIKMSLEALGCFVSLVPDGPSVNVIPERKPAAAEPFTMQFAPTKVMLDQLLPDSQWQITATGTPVRILRVMDGKVYAVCLYGLYQPMDAWQFAQAVQPAAEHLAALDQIDLAQFDDKPIVEIKMLPADPTFPIVDLPIGATVIHRGKRATIVSAYIADGQPVASLLGEGEDAVPMVVAVTETAELVGLAELSPLVYHVLASATPVTPAEEPSAQVDSEAPVGEADATVTEGHQHLVSTYWVNQYGLTFKVLQVDEAKGMALCLEDGAAEEEWDDLEHITAAIASGKCRKAYDFEILDFDAADEAKAPADNLVQFPAPESPEGGEQPEDDAANQEGVA